MITTNDIKDGICKQLDAAGLKVSGENYLPEDGTAIIQLGVDLVTSELMGAGRQVHRTYLVDAMWSRGPMPANEEMNAAQEAIAAALTPYVRVGGRSLKPENVRYNKTDGLAHVLFELAFYEAGAHDDGPMMAHLKIYIGGND